MAELIPKVIHTTWPGFDPERPDYTENRAAFRELMPDWRHMHWDGQATLSLAPEVYDVAPERAVVRSDLVRIKAVQTFGGIYLDSDVRLFKPLDGLRETGGFFVREPYKSGSLANCVFGASHDLRGHLSILYDLFLERARQSPEKNPLFLAGPRALTKYEDYLSMSGFVIVDSVFFYPCGDDKRAGRALTSHACAYGVHEEGGTWR